MVKQTFAADDGVLKVVQGGFASEILNTSLMSIDASGKAVAQTNPEQAVPAAFGEIIINNQKVLLLSNMNDRLKSVGGTSVSLKALGNDDFATLDDKKTTMPSGAKGGWVGSIGKFGFEYGEWSNMRFGVYVDEKNVSHLFVHGKKAPVRDTTGVFAYSGSAIIGKDGNYRPLENAVTGAVNWGEKTVNLTIQDGNNSIPVGGKIQGNTFGGNTNGVETRGAFYGTSELGGIFHATGGQYDGYNGVFGATRGGRVGQ